MDIEWIAQDETTLAHASKLKVDGKAAVTPLAVEIVSPQRATTQLDESVLRDVGRRLSPKTTMVIAGENLARQTLDNVGYNKQATDALMARLKQKKIPGSINLVFPRIPNSYATSDGTPLPVPEINDSRALALVDVQLEADASLIIPPMPGGLNNRKQYELSLERTFVAIQTFRVRKEVVGYIPTTNQLEIARDLTEAYVRRGVRFFAVDFSSASNQPSLMRTVVRTIRKRLKLKKVAKESDEKYYLHTFNVAVSRKSKEVVSPLSDIIIHPYGVDSTSSQMWGGGKLDVERLRYYMTDDYGAYRRKALATRELSCTCEQCSDGLDQLYSGSVNRVADRLRVHRISAYADECGRITEKISSGRADGAYRSYLTTKSQARQDVGKILADVREIQAAP
jgi:hypothetical protein